MNAYFRQYLLFCVIATSLENGGSEATTVGIPPGNIATTTVTPTIGQSVEVQDSSSEATTIQMGDPPNQTTTTIVTPTIGQSVELQCGGSDVGKQWYTTGSEVTATQNEISTSAVATRILAFSLFTPSHAGTYTCLVSSPGDTQTKTTYPVVLVNPSATNTLTVGRTDDPITTITITPTLSQPVKLECQRTNAFKDWFTGDPRSRVTPTEGEISTKPGHDRTLLISSFQPIHATTYSCVMDLSNSISTVYPVVLETPPPLPEISPPSQVQGVMFCNGTSLNVSWTAVTGTDPKYAIGYVVRYSTDRGTETDPPSDAMKRSGITATSTTLTELQPNTTYYVWVAAEILGAGVQGPYTLVTPTTTVTATATYTDTALVIPTTSVPATTTDLPPTTVGIIAGIIVVLLALIATVVVILCILFIKKRKLKEREKDLTYVYSAPHRTFMYSPDTDQNVDNDLTNAIWVGLEDLGNSKDVQGKIETSNSIVDDSFHEDISKNISKTQFAAYVREMRMEKDAGFEKEYKEIQNDPRGKDDVAKSHKNKNRYFNIHTFDHSRVVLLVPDEKGSDYINASYIDGFEQKNAYIASQGPTPNTISDFWQMIWDNRPPVIVMLTQPEEKGKKKCERYWKDDIQQVFEPGRGFYIKLMSCNFFADFEVREMLVKNMAEANSKSFTLKHFLYTGWPDHGVPQHPSSLIQFIKQVRKVYRNSQSPLIVHCSAGVGRTGTFITIDAMIRRLKKRDDLNIYGFITKMRSKRTFMVQSLDQYVFIHDALNDYLICGETAVPAHELRKKITDLEAPVEDMDMTGFQFEFDILNSVSRNVCSEDIEYSKKSPVAWKNRYKDRFPYSLNHLHISGRPAENGIDYLNASFINNYSNNNSSEQSFIAAQSPLMHTRDDFWEVVWQLKTSVIVLICDSRRERDNCVQFWPSGNAITAEYSFLKVDLMYVENNPGYIIYNLKVSDKRKPEYDSFELTLFNSIDWKADGPVQITPLMRMIEDVEKKKCGSEKPVIVMCDDGMGRTGVFITVMTEIERVKVEREVDIFQTVKTTRVQRPNMVSTVAQYKLCYEMLQAYISSFDNYANFKVV